MVINIKQKNIFLIHQSKNLFLFLLLILMTLCLLNNENVHGQSNNAIIPSETIKLFNGEDLSGFYTWLEGGLEFDDPNNVFSIVDQIDGVKAIRISGEDWGGLITEQIYTNYHLIAEFRWGNVAYGARKDHARDSGILLHVQGPEGNYHADLNGPWMRCVQYQIKEGATGDFILIGGYTEDGEYHTSNLKATVSQDYNGEYYWDSEGRVKEFEGGRINWYGRDPDWRNHEFGFRGIQDVEKPVGEWNRVEAIVDGDTFEFLLNGKIVNKGFDSDLKEGKLKFQSEGAEIFFRRIELRPLP